MLRYRVRHQFLAIGLAALAGFVDAIGFLALGGLFVSFMSGNSTQLAVESAKFGNGIHFAGALILAFVLGVMGGTVAGNLAGRWRKQAAMLLVLGLLLVACSANLSRDHLAVTTLFMAGAMGAANAVFQRAGEVSIGVTYMTGTLVKLAQYIVIALSGGARLAWLPYLLLWLGLIGGAMAGATAFHRLGLQALWIAVGLQAMLVAHSFALGPTSTDR